MAFFSKTTISLLLIIIFFLFVSSSFSPFVNGETTPRSEGCSPLIPTILDKCLPFVAIGSQADKPEAKCCLAVKTEMLTGGCLCEEFKDNVYSMGIEVNVTKASTLPDACKLVDPSMASCGLSPPPPPATLPPPPPPPPPATASAPAPAAGSRTGSDSAPTPSQRNHGSSLTPISTFSFVTTGALVILCFI